MMRWAHFDGCSIIGRLIVAGACSFLLQSQVAQAALGDGAGAMKAAQTRFSGVRSESANGPVTTLEVRMADGSSVKEYVNPAGVVFAVSWRTRLKPDLEVLLGERFVAQAAKIAAPAGVAGIKSYPSIRQPNLVVHQAGRMSAFAGLAYDPTLVPEGVNAEALR